MAYKFKQEGVLSQRANAASKTQDEHDSSNDNKKPHRVKAPEICDRWQIGQHTLREWKKRERTVTVLTAILQKSTFPPVLQHPSIRLKQMCDVK